VKRWLLILLALLFPSLLAAQSTLVSGTITDQGGQVWANGTYTFSFQPAPTNPAGPYFWNGAPFNTSTVISGNLNASGAFSSVSVPSNSAITPSGSTWIIDVCPAATGLTCYPVNLSVTGTSLSVTSLVVPPAVQVNVSAPFLGYAAYSDSEIVGARQGSFYTNLTDKTIHYCSTVVPCTWVSLSGGGGGGSPGSPAFSTQLANAALTGFLGTPCQGFATLAAITSGPIINDCDTEFVGPNPYIDLRAYGVRGLSTGGAIPASSGITAITTSGNPTITVSTTSCTSQSLSICFVNGDGVVVVGVGNSQSMTTPGSITVTPMNSRVGTGTGDGVAAPTGSTTYNYKVFACDEGGGCTAPSSTVTTATGASPLGYQFQAVTITGITRSNNINTYATSSQPPFSVGTVVHVDNCPGSGDNNNGFNGWVYVTAVNSTNFQAANLPEDTRNGAATASAAGCSATYWNYNRLAFTTSGSSAFRYFACSDRQSPGTFALVAQSLTPVDPQGNGTGYGNLEIDDFGQTMSSGQVGSMPWYLSNANCAGSATRDNLVTTITSGAGTTSLVLSSAPQFSLSGTPIRFDNAPNLRNGLSNVVIGYLPYSGVFVVNSFLNLSGLSNAPILAVSNNLFLNDTLYLGGGARIYGDRPNFTSASADSFEIQANPIITGNVNPAIVASASGGVTIQGITVHGPCDGMGVIFYGAGGNLGAVFDSDNFTTNACGSSDYLGVALYAQGPFTTNTQLYVTSGTQAQSDESFTPSLWVDNSSETSIANLMASARGALVRAPSSGGVFHIGHFHWQANTAPIVTVTDPNGGISAEDVIIGDSGAAIIDTGNHSLFACLPGVLGIEPVGSLQVFNLLNPPASGVTSVTGNCGTNYSSTITALSGQSSNQAALSINNLAGVAALGASSYISGTVQGASILNYGPAVPEIGALMIAAPVAPSLAVSSGGNVPVGNHSYQLAWFDYAGNPTALGVSASVTTTTGNQTVTITPPSAPLGAVGYVVFRDGVFLLNSAAACSTPYSHFGLGTFTDIYASACGQSTLSQNLAMSMGGFLASLIGTSPGLFGPNYSFIGNGFASTWSGSFTAARSVTIPDLSGTALLTPWNSYIDVTEIAAPSNPISGNERWYANNSTHQFTCLTSSGGNCNPSGSGTVSSVSNSDGSLTISPTTGAVVASLNVAHQNTFTANQAFPGIVLNGSSSGSLTQVCAGTCGTVTVTWGNTSGTPATSATSPLSINSTTGVISCPTCATGNGLPTGGVLNQALVNSGASGSGQWASPSIGVANGGSLITSAYTLQCDSATASTGIIDRGKNAVIGSGGSVTIPDLSSSGCAGFYGLLENSTSGNVTVSRQTSDTFTIYGPLGGAPSTGQTSLTLSAGQTAVFSPEPTSTVYDIRVNQPTVAFSNLTGSAACSQLPALTGDTTTSAGSCATVTGKINGTAVSGTAGDAVKYGSGGTTLVDSGLAMPTAAGSATVTQDIASGTAAMGTSAISSGSCATVVTVSASGVATTDVITVGFNGDPTAVTGYGASSSGALLTIYPYPTSGNVNFKVCNSTASSITPGALTLNWKVVR
jgi:hypothetical protein